MRREIDADEFETHYVKPWLELIKEDISRITELQKKHSNRTHHDSAPPIDLERELTKGYREQQKEMRAAANSIHRTLEEYSRLDDIRELQRELSIWKTSVISVRLAAEANSWWNPMTLIAKCAAPFTTPILWYIGHRDKSLEEDLKKTDSPFRKRLQEAKKAAHYHAERTKIRPVLKKAQRREKYYADRKGISERRKEFEGIRTLLQQFIKDGASDVTLGPHLRYSVDASVVPPPPIATLNKVQRFLGNHFLVYHKSNQYLAHQRKTLYVFLKTGGASGVPIRTPDAMLSAHFDHPDDQVDRKRQAPVDTTDKRENPSRPSSGDSPAKWSI
jgi:hypothetical protein